MTKSSDATDADNASVRSPLPCPPEVLDILRHLRQAGHEAYLVGGCVRDYLMGRAPKDWDIATSAAPEEVEALFPRTVPVGKSFGVIMVVTPGGAFEVATFRGEHAYVDGRRPSGVYFTSAREDVTRRDFTINALLYDPETDRVIDYVGGRRDLAEGVLRTVGNPRQRFREDHLRLLRAVRFAARSGFRIEPETFAAMVELRSLVADLSGERVGEELTRMLCEGYAGPAFGLLDATGLLDEVLPEIAALRGVPQPPEFHPEGDVWTHVRIMLGALDETMRVSLAAPPDSDYPCGNRLIFTALQEREILAWATLLHDVGKPDTIAFADRIRFHGHDTRGMEMAADILARMRRSGRVSHGVVALVKDHMRFMHICQMRVAKRRRFVQDPLFPLHLELHRFDCLASHSDFSCYDFGLSAWLEERARPPAASPLLRGEDLLAAGYTPGPLVGKILRAVDDARLEGILENREQALAWVQQRFTDERQ